MTTAPQPFQSQVSPPPFRGMFRVAANLSSVPAELRKARTWVLWKLEERDGRATKIPYTIMGMRADTTDPGTWTSFEKALENFDSTIYSGLGCVITPPYFGVDLDNCRDPQTGETQPWALDAIAALDTYTEISQSGRGYHLWGKGTIPSGGNRRGQVEMYASGRYFTMTGQQYDGTPLTIAERDLTAFHGKYILATNSINFTNSTNSTTTTAQSTQKDTSLSVVEFKLACDIVKWLGPNATLEDVKLEFFKQGDYREKWAKHATYVDRTIRAAMDKVHRSSETKLIHDAPERTPPPPAAMNASIVRVEVLPPAEIEIRETDLGNALRFVERHGENVRHCAALGWLAWDGKRWKQQSGEALKAVTELVKNTVNAILHEADNALRTGEMDKAERLCKWAHRSQSNARICAALALAESDPRISVTASELDTHPMLLNLENGTLDLQTFELRPHRKEDNITKLCPVVYDPQAKHAEFTKFIERILPDEEVRSFMQRWFGYCLTGSTGEQKFVIAHGEGANGKSQLLEVFRNLLAEDQYAKRSKFDTFRDGRHGETRNDIACFKGMRLVTVSESAEDVRLDEALVKDLTGGEGVTARFLYHEFFTFTPEFKLTLSTNYKPTIHGQDYAIWRRVCLVPFEVQIPEKEQEKDIHTRLLREEASGILNWALAGLREQQEIGLKPPAKVQAATEEYRAEQDIIAQFLQERCEIGLFEEQSTAVYEAYSDWATGAGYKPWGLRRFNSRLALKGFKDGGHTREGKVWLGLKLKRQWIM